MSNHEPEHFSSQPSLRKLGNAKTNQVNLIKYDDERRLQLEFALQQINSYRFVITVTTPNIIAKVFNFARANPYSRAVCYFG